VRPGAEQAFRKKTPLMIFQCKCIYRVLADRAYLESVAVLAQAAQCSRQVRDDVDENNKRVKVLVIVLVLILILILIFIFIVIFNI